MAGVETTEPTDVKSKFADEIKLTTKEVAAVKAAFPNRCRVIENAGYSVTVQPKDMDVTIKFKLSVAYPTTLPEITIRSESLKQEHIHDLIMMLTSKASSMLGGPMIQVLIAEAEKELHNFGLRRGKANIVNSHTYIGGKAKKPKKSKKKLRQEDEEIEDKLPSMKTADDVIKRIIWDDALEKDDFLVGYIDRFRGLVEKYFSAFSWEDLASVDYDVLAVPKHRIQYFKYKDVKVWEKAKRLDNVFGSANGSKTIDVVIREHTEVQASSQTKDAASQGAISEETSNNDNSFSSNTSDSDDDSDEDDGITVTIGAGVGIGETRVSKRSLKDDQQKEAYDPHWENKLRPNYFLCVRITNPEIMDQIGNVQDHLMTVEPLFGECCIPGMALHMTLCTLGLDTAEQLQNCIDTLNKIKPDLADALPTSQIDLHGVGNFYNRVIYAKVNHKKDFMKFYNVLKLFLKEAGDQIRDGYDFVPHVTIMKTSRPVSRLRGSKNIDPKIYEKFCDQKFGEENITAIYLCSMAKERRQDGFYLTPLELHFTDQ